MGKNAEHAAKERNLEEEQRHREVELAAQKIRIMEACGRGE